MTTRTYKLADDTALWDALTASPLFHLLLWTVKPVSILMAVWMAWEVHLLASLVLTVVFFFADFFALLLTLLVLRLSGSCLARMATKD